MLINGYYLKTGNLAEIMQEVKKIRARLGKTASAEYHCMLGEKIAFICDNIALGIYNRNPGGVIFQDAVNALAAEMDTAFRLNAQSRYNFQVYLHAIPSDGGTYLKVTCPNRKLLKAFRGLEEYSLTEEESQNKKNAKTVTWVRLCEESQKNEPFALNLTPVPVPDPCKVTYPDIGERCEKMARHNLLNHYLNQVSGGSQIQPALLMEYMDRAMEMLLSAEGQRELEQKRMSLAQILMDLEGNPGIVTEPFDASLGQGKDKAGSTPGQQQ